MRSISGLILLTAGLMTGGVLRAAEPFQWGGSIRGYQFFRTEDLPPPFPDTRRDLEFASLRLTWEADFSSRIQWEGHAVLDILSPPQVEAAGVATSRTATFLPLETDFVTDSDYQLEGRLDRLNLQVDFRRARVTVGRQAIGWGVAYFWPTLDLFSPFAPERIDRDYKAGVDAVRVTVPVGRYSELQVVGAVLGPSFDDDGAAAAQLRLKWGRADLGLMGGRFHGDTVAGAFFTTDASGTALRGEAAWTLSGDAFEQRLDRRTFFRATLGVDRQLTPDVGVTLEIAYNGFGVGSASRYLLLAQTDRVARGEVSSLGTYYAGTAVTWQIRPLWTLSQALLVNAQDPSALWIPALEWSTSDNSTLLMALQTGLGGQIGSRLTPESEYGLVPTTAFLAFKWYF